jgi:prephenate dehydrogenase
VIAGEALGIAGLGLIGGSLALRARAEGIRVVGYDRDPAVVAAARAGGALDENVATLGALAERCTVVALALPVDAIVAALETTDALAAPRLVFDVGSVKAPIAAAGRRFPRFVASHPLAGREVGGFGAAVPGLFAGRPWVIDPAADPAARELLTALIATLGGHPVALDPVTHDRLLALTSHLPQVLSVVLGARLAAAGGDDSRAYDVCGPGMESMLRLARSPRELWAPIARANAAPLAAELRGYAQALEAVASDLENGELSALMQAFARAGAAVAALGSTR